MLTFKKGLVGDLLARAYYLLGLRSHTDLVAEHCQSQNLLSICLTTAIKFFLIRSELSGALDFSPIKHDWSSEIPQTFHETSFILE